MKNHLKYCVLLMLLLLMSACDTQQENDSPIDESAITLEPVATGALICELEPALCEQRCSDCDDPEACFAAGGACKQANFSYNDTGDNGIDVFTPGCHYLYPNSNACQGTGQRFSEDSCGIQNVNLILEWDLSTCHGPTGDLNIYDCDKICRQLGRGGGTCKTVANACGAGWDSARCECDQPPPPGPNPTVSG